MSYVKRYQTRIVGFHSFICYPNDKDRRLRSMKYGYQTSLYRKRTG